jgi:hypothetical protein
MPSSPSSPNLLATVDKISPLPKAAVVNTKKKQGVSQKATELTSSPYNLTLEEAGKKPGSKTRSGSSNHKQQKRLKAASIIPHESWFCEMCEEVSEENMILLHVCMSCRRWVHENCACVKKSKKVFLFQLQIKLFIHVCYS